MGSSIASFFLLLITTIASVTNASPAIGIVAAPTIISSSAVSATARSLECGKDARVILDQRALELTNFGDSSFRFPETEVDIDDWYCPRVINAAKCIKNYAYTCLRPLPRQLVKLFVADNKTQTDACEGSPEVRRDRIIPYFKCLNRAVGGIHECARKTAHALNHINYHVPGANAEKKFQYTCREYHELSCCIQQQLRESCTPDVAEIAKVYFDRATHSTANFMCRFYPKDSPFLRDLPPIDYDGDDMLHTSCENSKSILVGLIDLYNRANEEIIDAVSKTQ